MNTSSRIPDLILEQHRLGELPPEESREIDRRLAGDDGLRKRVGALSVSDQEVFRVSSAEEFAAAVRRRVAAAPDEGREREPQVWLVAATSSALVLIATLVFYRPDVVGVGAGQVSPGGAERAIDRDSDRLKGAGPALQVFMMGKGPLDSGATARAGDVVQLVYQAGGNRFGVIVSVDGQGKVTRHLPLEGAAAGPLRTGGAVTLGTAYRLDDAPRAERFYLVVAPEPFTIDVVETAARAAAPDPAAIVRLALPPTLAQASFLLKKE